MQNFIDSRLGRIALHILFWVFYLGMQVSIYGYTQKNYLDTLTGFIYAMPAFLLSTYFTLYVLFPHFLFKKRFILFGILLIISALVFTSLYRILQHYVIYPRFYPQLNERFEFFSVAFFGTMIGLYMVVGLASALKLLRFWYKHQNIQQQLINQNVQSELAMLRSQINPHFLFNTLNNIDSLITSAPKKASDGIMKLADIMRYMLYESSTDFVLLDKEIDYLKSYISLQLMRLKDQDFVELNIDQYYSGKFIAPMILIPFVENAFKHGDKQRSPGIFVKIETNDNYLNLFVKNYIPKNLNKNKDKTSGVGLVNVKRRLDLIYHDNYELDIHNNVEQNQFIINMKVNLTEENES